jgi:soluble lytic murein transglycosylase-like protein
MKNFKKVFFFCLPLLFFGLLISRRVSPTPNDLVHTKSQVNPNRIQQKIYATFKTRLPARYEKLSWPLTATVLQQSAKYKIDPMIITSVISGESNFNPSVIGHSGEVGLMQLRPSTGKWIAQKSKIKWNPLLLKNPFYNIRLGVAYLGYLKRRYSPSKGYLYLAAYNMGETTMLRLLSSKKIPHIYPAHIMKNFLAINQ